MWWLEMYHATSYMEWAYGFGKLSCVSNRIYMPLFDVITQVKSIQKYIDYSNF